MGKIDVKIAETHRITSPVNESLTVNSDEQISMRGAEGTTMESKDIVWSADTDILLKSVNGSIVFDGKDGVSIDVENIPVAPIFLQNPSGHEQYKVCVCMPQGKLFRVLVRTGASTRSVNCARISRTPENDRSLFTIEHKEKKKVILLWFYCLTYPALPTKRTEKRYRSICNY